MRRWSLLLMCLLATPLPAQPGEGSTARTRAREVEGFGLTEQAAKNNAIKKIIEEITSLLERQDPPLTAWRPTADFVRRHVIQGEGTGPFLEDTGVVAGKKWVYRVRALDSGVFRALDQEAQRQQRSEQRIIWGGQVFGAFTLALAGFTAYAKARSGRRRRDSANRG